MALNGGQASLELSGCTRVHSKKGEGGDSRKPDEQGKE